MGPTFNLSTQETEAGTMSSRSALSTVSSRTVRATQRETLYQKTTPPPNKAKQKTISIKNFSVKCVNPFLSFWDVGTQHIFYLISHTSGTYALYCHDIPYTKPTV